MLNAVNELMWGPGTLALLLGTGVFLTLRMRLLPWRRLGFALRSALGREARQPGKDGVSPFSALMTALAASIGTGNIVGVATALVAGGPGALVWMELSALFGMATIFAESFLAVRYRRRDPQGQWVGGPMYVLEAVFGRRNGRLLGTVFARFTGINMSMCVLLMFLYMGAKPVECIAAMLMFNVFTYFTVYSQLHVMKIKSFTFFPGVRLAIPILITIALAALNPFIGIVFFVFTFLMEIFAKIYKEMDAKSRPTKGKIGQMVVIAAILVTIGAAIVQFIPENYYYIVGGVTILIYAFVMWRTGDRRKGTAWWDKMLYASTFLTGLSGIDGTDWLTAMRRNPESVLSKCYPIVINGAMIIGLLASYAMYQYFSLGALFATIGSAVGIRLFGLYEHKEKGSFSYLTLGIAVLAALVFMIIQPVPTGFPVVPMADQTGFFDF